MIVKKLGARKVIVQSFFRLVTKQTQRSFEVKEEMLERYARHMHTSKKNLIALKYNACRGWITKRLIT